MKTEAIDIRHLEDLLERSSPSAGADGAHAPPEHPLARRLRMVLTDPSAHSIGDLARVADALLREMTMLQVAAEAPADPATAKSN